MGSAYGKEYEYQHVIRDLPNQEWTFEATFKSFNMHNNGDVEIICNLALLYHGAIKRIKLKRSNPNYANIYNSLICKNVYEFVYKIEGENYYLLQVREPPIHTLTDKITGFLDLSQEFKAVTNKYQLLFEKNHYDRIIVQESKDFSIGSTYEIKYKKHEGGRLYYVVEYKLIYPVTATNSPDCDA